MPSKSRLTQQQRRFVNNYIDTLDPTKSAINAGYHAATAKTKARELLSNPAIIAEIHAQAEKSALSLNIPNAFIVKKLLQIINSAFVFDDVPADGANAQCAQVSDGLGDKKNRAERSGTKIVKASHAQTSTSRGDSGDDCQDKGGALNSGAQLGGLKLKDASVALRAVDILSKFITNKSPENPLDATNNSVRIMCIENLNEDKI